MSAEGVSAEGVGSVRDARMVRLPAAHSPEVGRLPTAPVGTTVATRRRRYPRGECTESTRLRHSSPVSAGTTITGRRAIRLAAAS
ncbi:hypothetical protein [Rhodococcus globerulus]|uniref:Uncharacterized protein n=1 Tax=Rhodococcus globerulus TaxID=33008 RepID=A0ABU4C499_RHOGO|nr:hypothetical protein [Rhodococcus globerulus]MDV6271327.1 hypothetical protein [Rhodococcus globerulus]